MELLPPQLKQSDIFFPETKETVIKPRSDFFTLYKVISDYKTKPEQHLKVAQMGKKFIDLFCSLADKRTNYGKQRVTKEQRWCKEELFS